MDTRRVAGTKTSIARPGSPARAVVPPTVETELAALVTAVAGYDPANPNDRAAATVVAQARELLASVKEVREAESNATILAAWAELKTLTAPDVPTLQILGDVLTVCQRIHRMVAEREARRPRGGQG